MSTIALTKKAMRLLELCEAEGFETVEDLIQASMTDSVSPAICMECAHAAKMEPDQRAGYCEACHTNRMVSGLVLADFI
ncbi:hypothetical protein [Bradyrhizobium japonicum]|uniref:hypothetical protein n=1 Tax=Bradyrhizobium japonicum TaxID=375 RepID=UPI001BA897DB|nr:hypothetical protein [Bradyrhizobium japonicum]MBR0960899.1 hypothetical protein [Bradyrhizobium japonicum]